jgi:hypothetical protein
MTWNTCGDAPTGAASPLHCMMSLSWCMRQGLSVWRAGRRCPCGTPHGLDGIGQRCLRSLASPVRWAHVLRQVTREPHADPTQGVPPAAAPGQFHVLPAAGAVRAAYGHMGLPRLRTVVSQTMVPMVTPPKVTRVPNLRSTSVSLFVMADGFDGTDTRVRVPAPSPRRPV